MTRPFVVYLLHFDLPDGGTRHYVGLTTPGRLARRFTEHANGRGARFTRRMLEQNATFRCSRIWPTATPHLERIIKNGGHFRQRCPVCSTIKRRLPPCEFGSYKRGFSPLNNAEHPLIGW